MNDHDTTSQQSLPLRRFVGYLGAIVAMAVLIWAPLGMLGAVPSMLDVFGAEQLRTPASIAVAGLLVAAVGFYEA